MTLLSSYRAKSAFLMSWQRERWKRTRNVQWAKKKQTKKKPCIDPTKDIQECIQSTAFSATLSCVSRSNDRNPATLVQVRRNSLGTPASCWGNELDFMPSIYVSAENSFASYWYCIALPKTQGYSPEHRNEVPLKAGPGYPSAVGLRYLLAF